MNRERLFQRLAQGALQNVSFRDMAKLVEGFSFRWRVLRAATISSCTSGFPNL